MAAARRQRGGGDKAAVVTRLPDGAIATPLALLKPVYALALTCDERRSRRAIVPRPVLAQSAYESSGANAKPV